MPRTQTFLYTAVLFLLAAATILGAWAFELIGGYAPCHLCLMQRDPYYGGLVVAALALFAEATRKPRWLVIGLLVLVALGFLYGGGLGVYHAGSEWHFWQGPTDCGITRGADIPKNAGDLLSTLNDVRIPSCTEPQWRMFGISFAGYNALVSVVLVGMALLAIRAKKA